MNTIECPYCNASLEVRHDDGSGYEEDKAHEMRCSQCRKNFVFHTAVSYNYTPRKADCLNGSPHRFAHWVGLWERDGKSIQSRRCYDCDHREGRSVPISPANVRCAPTGAFERKME
jgi:hypothetical protein